MPSYLDRILAPYDPVGGEVEMALLELHPDVILGVTDDLRIAYVNPAWFEFAEANCGDVSTWCLGASVLDAITGPQRRYYAEAFERVLATGSPWRHFYECSSANTFREFRMQVLPMRQQRGLLIIHTLVTEGQRHLHDEGEPTSSYERTDGTILQCFHCRRVERAGQTGAWDFVPRFVESLPDNVTGGLCLPCLRTHYPTAEYDPC